MRQPLTDDNSEVRKLTVEDMRLFRPIADVDPCLIDAVAAYRRRGGPTVAEPKQRMGFRLAADVVAGIGASRRG